MDVKCGALCSRCVDVCLLTQASGTTIALTSFAERLKLSWGGAFVAGWLGFFQGHTVEIQTFDVLKQG